MNEPDDYPDLFLEGIRLFNAEEFYECHDAFEDLWNETLGEERLFIQGLLQAGVSLFHFGNENYGGAMKLYRAATKKLTPYPSLYWGVDLGKFLSDYRNCFQELLDAGPAYPSGIALQADRVPRIDFDPDRRD